MARLRVAFFSPLNPVSSGISDYSEELLPALAEHAQTDVFVEGYEPTNVGLKDYVAVYDYRRYEQLASERRYDIALYQMGNSGCHRYIYEMLQRHPGVTVLHDVKLQHFMHEAYLSRGQTDVYLREIAYSHGTDGQRSVRTLLPESRPSPFEYPSFARVVDSSLGLIVHSQYAARLIHDIQPDARVVCVPQVMPLPPEIDRRTARERAGVLPDQFVVGSFGRITPAKRIDVALRAFAELRRVHPDAVYLFVGESTPDSALITLIHSLGIRSSVRFVGYVPLLDDFYEYAAACDVCVNLRHPTIGETSAAALRLMAIGLPTVVTAVDAFQDLPDDCCVKIQPGSSEHGDLARQLLALAADRRRRRQIGENARQFIKQQQHPDTVARAYVSALNQFLTSPSRSVARERLVADTGYAMSEIGLGGTALATRQQPNPFIASVSHAIEELLPEAR